MDQFRKSSDLQYATIFIQGTDIMPDGSVNLTAHWRKTPYRIDLVDFMITSQTLAAGDVVLFQIENPRSVPHINMGYVSNSNANQISNRFLYESSIAIPIETVPTTLYQPQRNFVISIDNNMGNELNFRFFFKDQTGQPLVFDSIFMRLLVYVKPEVLFQGTNVGHPYTLRLNH